MHHGRIQPRLRRLGGLVSPCLLVAALSAAAVTASPSPAALAQSSASVPHLDHVFVIMEENNGFHDVIGNPAAPNLNYLARTFGVETDYFGVSPDSSESNYVGLLGGSVFGITSDDAYWKNQIHAPSLISQLDQAGSAGRPTCRRCPIPITRGSAIQPSATGPPTATRSTSPSTTPSRTSRRR